MHWNTHCQSNRAFLYGKHSEHSGTFELIALFIKSHRVPYIEDMVNFINNFAIYQLITLEENVMLIKLYLQSVK